LSPLVTNWGFFSSPLALRPSGIANFKFLCMMHITSRMKMALVARPAFVINPWRSASQGSIYPLLHPLFSTLFPFSILFFTFFDSVIQLLIHGALIAAFWIQVP
jgi:hypothetical protein